MSYLYFVIQTKSRTEDLYHAFVIRKGEFENLAHMTEDYSTKYEQVVTINCWPKSKCELQRISWNDNFKAQGKLMPWDYSLKKKEEESRSLAEGGDDK